MKKKILFKFLIASFSIVGTESFSASGDLDMPKYPPEEGEDNPRKGVFIELGAGYGAGTLKARDTYARYLQPVIFIGNNTTMYGSVNSVKASTNQRGAVGSLSMGFNLPFWCHYMVGFIGGGTLTSLKGRIAYPVTFVSGATSTPGYQYTQVVNKGSANACMRFGFWLKRTLVFMKAGWTTMRLTLRADPKTSYTWFKANNIWVRGALLGIGAETYVAPTTVLGLAVDIATYGQKLGLIYAVPQGKEIRNINISVYSKVRPVHCTIMATIKWMYPDIGF